MALVWLMLRTAAVLDAVKTDRRGVAALEYAVLAVGIVLSVVAASRTLGTNVSTIFGTVAGKL